ncbi:peptidase M23 [Paucihalobacter ruber]|uniref:Peptidase M23 n=1 Tax=Paucihalobacter ruber TaxID=2567861 RepID=A0A506PIU9_9FLAO|nr:peptidoglycan DD-metalloendopeptidase family protein [Paucihalobacter ruber]TPV32310.1 peptidase M23 [Paucihalobacter ruber]
MNNFENLLIKLSTEAASVLPDSINKIDFCKLDLSVFNDAIRPEVFESSVLLENFVWAQMKRNNAKVAVGGYLEPRGIYRRSTHFNEGDTLTERNIHLGLDLWIEAGTPIFAPLNAEVHSFKNNQNFGDYGPTIILKHQVEGFEFYTLYGHLSLESLKNLLVGQKIAKGQQIATLGTATVNGDYPPHLHFQIIKDIEDYSGDYPGVCSKLELGYYMKNCPNPDLLINLFN